MIVWVDNARSVSTDRTANVAPRRRVVSSELLPLLTLTPVLTGRLLRPSGTKRTG